MSDEITQTPIEENTTVVPSETIPTEVVTPPDPVRADGNELLPASNGTSPIQIEKTPEVIPQVSEPISKPTLEPISEPVIEPVSEITTEPITQTELIDQIPTQEIPVEIINTPEVVIPTEIVTPSEIVSIPEIPIDPVRADGNDLLPASNGTGPIQTNDIENESTSNGTGPTQIENPPTITEPIKEENIIRSFLLKLLDKANLAIKTRNTKRLEKLTIFFDTNPRVTNNMVEKLLKVSDSTATNYLKKLKNQGKIIQHGTHGSGIFYTKA
ncbi:hypothetical protein A2903_00190 [Candidatus Nomurabacteria bacterium RIFCSPLOWO2_01_FULL_33_17]|uniref:Uncharacterized protein n=1 Tax=Candidatus Nomurabacteria bacterium RIFCSPLOWO2_01_FULL_33_17 TaxID=1801764 RepID=A0A1F6WPK1_9BACT|nr:MAG: hypothetical protein A2903_00190 [Candidatus Nomurabacteria bacterium RIFCSPLOWO2_01_FULL_33_17]